MADSIVYVGLSKPGGVDGRGSDKGGKRVKASLKKGDCVGGWTTEVAEVVDLTALATETMKKLDPVERLAIERHYTVNTRGR